MNRDNVFMEVGKAIGLIQMADSAFRHMILFAFPETGMHELSELEKGDKVLRKATLGRLISILRARVILREDFETLLAGYLKDRNALVHHWEDIDGWRDEHRAIEFSIHVQKTAAYMFFVFSAFIRAWMDQVGINLDKQHPELRDYFVEIDSKWKPFAANFIDEVKITKETA